MPKAIEGCAISLSKAGVFWLRARRFNPRVPWGTRRSDFLLRKGNPKFQSTRPVGDATCARRTQARARACFNPRVPWGTRPNPADTRRHAILFQSTRPVGDATSRRESAPTISQFQSTRPVGDATPGRINGHTKQRVSIHASRGGRDGALPSRSRATRPCFNPRVPWETRHQPGALWHSCGQVSIHASRGGRDSGLAKHPVRPLSFQSTRPVGDATSETGCRHGACTAFQSTRPVGDATRILLILILADAGFNPRVPWGTRRPPSTTASTAALFQSTRPVGDATGCRGQDTRSRGRFNPRVPWGTRPSRGASYARRDRVSIHASRGGRDRQGRWSRVIRAGFQSTRPVGDATRRRLCPSRGR